MINYFLRFFTMFNSLTGNFNISKTQQPAVRSEITGNPSMNLDFQRHDFKANVNPLSNIFKPGPSPLHLTVNKQTMPPGSEAFVQSEIPSRIAPTTPSFLFNIPTAGVLHNFLRRDTRTDVSQQAEMLGQFQNDNSGHLNLNIARKFPSSVERNSRTDVLPSPDLPGDILHVGIKNRFTNNMDHFNIFGNLPLTPTIMPSFTPIPPFDYPLPVENGIPLHLFSSNVTPVSKYPVPCDLQCREAVNCPFGFLQEYCPRCECAPDPCLTPCSSDREQCVKVPHLNCIDEDPFMCPQYSVCEEIGCGCPPIWQPVCGTDKELFAKTYVNNCSLTCLGNVEKIYDGECWPSNMERIYFSEPTSTTVTANPKSTTTATISTLESTTLITTTIESRPIEIDPSNSGLWNLNSSSTAKPEILKIKSKTEINNVTPEIISTVGELFENITQNNTELRSTTSPLSTQTQLSNIIITTTKTITAKETTTLPVELSVLQTPSSEVTNKTADGISKSSDGVSNQDILKFDKILNEIIETENVTLDSHI